MIQDSLIYTIPYFILMFVIFFSSISLISTNNGFIIKNTKIAQNFLLFVSLIFFFCFRGYVSADWLGYCRNFNSSPTLFSGINEIFTYINEQEWEKGYLIYTIILKTISPSFLFFQGFSSFIDLICLFIIFNQYAKRENTKLGFIYLCFFLFFGMGQSIDLARNNKSLLFFLFSLDFLFEKKFGKYFLLNLIGMLFHSSSIIYIILYFVFDKKISKKTIYLIWVVGIVLYFAHIGFVRTLFDLFSTFLPDKIATKISFYLNDANGNSLGFGFSFFERNFFLFLIICYKNKLEEKKYNIIFVNSFLLVYFFTFYFRDFGIISTRFPNLFAYSYWFLIPQIYNLMDKSKKKYLLFFLLLYGVLKVYKDCSSVNMYYDNFLFNYLEAGDRITILGKYYPFLNLEI